MVDYAAMTDDDLRAYVEEHESLAADAQEVLDERRRVAHRTMKAESAPYLDDALVHLAAQGYRLERESQHFEPGVTKVDNPSFWWRCYFPHDSDVRPFLFAKGFAGEDREILLDFAINILGNLRIWHERQQKIA